MATDMRLERRVRSKAFFGDHDVPSGEGLSLNDWLSVLE